MAQRRRTSPASRPSVAKGCLAAALAAVILFAASAEAWAQRGRPATGPRSPSVFIDLGVLESLGPPPNVPQLLQPTLRMPRMPSAPSPALRPVAPPADNGRIVLRPPTEKKKRAPRRTAPKRAAKKPAAPTQKAPEVAARKPEPVATAPKPPAPPKITRLEQKPLRPAPPVAAPAPAPPSRITPPAPPKVVARPDVPPPAIRPAPPPPKAEITPVPAKPPPSSEPKSEPPRQTAALPPSTTGFAPGRRFRLGFSSGDAKLDREAIRQLDAVVSGMRDETALRLQLMAYADGTATSASQSRRLSLSRALAVRSYLIEKGVRSTRIDVRALGNKVQGGPPDRVDVIVTNR